MQKIYFWQIDCISNLAILYGLCILDSSFLYNAPNFEEVDGAYWFGSVRGALRFAYGQERLEIGF